MADSIVQTVQAPQLIGSWIHDPGNPAVTERQWFYTDGGDQSVSIDEQLLRFVGRRFPMLETGTSEDEQIAVSIVIPHGPDRLPAVEWWLARKRAARTLMYRDGRGRAFKAALVGPIAPKADVRGTTLSVVFQRVDYPAAATLAASDYQTGVADDGGKGDGGKGLRGKGL